MTTYVVLLPGEEAHWEQATEEERHQTYERHREFAAALAARGHQVTGGAELTHSREARVVRRVGGEVTASTGPYAETVEQLTGFYLVESEDLDDLVSCTGILIADEADGGIEVRAAVPGPDAAPEGGAS